MAKKSKKVRKQKTPIVDVKKAQANDRTETTTANKKVSAATMSVRSSAAKRTGEGKFTKAMFALIGGKECPRFGAMTWKERDAFMDKPENKVVRDRYEAHLQSVAQTKDSAVLR
jgi:hypothetical protein